MATPMAPKHSSLAALLLSFLKSGEETLESLRDQRYEESAILQAHRTYMQEQQQSEEKRRAEIEAKAKADEAKAQAEFRSRGLLGWVVDHWYSPNNEPITSTDTDTGSRKADLKIDKEVYLSGQTQFQAHADSMMEFCSELSRKKNSGFSINYDNLSRFVQGYSSKKLDFPSLREMLMQVLFHDNERSSSNTVVKDYRILGDRVDRLITFFTAKQIQAVIELLNEKLSKEKSKEYSVHTQGLVSPGTSPALPAAGTYPPSSYSPVPSSLILSRPASINAVAPKKPGVEADVDSDFGIDFSPAASPVLSALPLPVLKIHSGTSSRNHSPTTSSPVILTPQDFSPLSTEEIGYINIPVLHNWIVKVLELIVLKGKPCPMPNEIDGFIEELTKKQDRSKTAKRY